MAKKEMIKNGEDISLDDGNVMVLNGVSVAEKSTEVKKELDAAKEPEEVKKTDPIVVNEEPKKEEPKGEIKKEDQTLSKPIIPTIPVSDVQPKVSLANPAPIEFPKVNLSGNAKINEQNDFPQININQTVPEFNNNQENDQTSNKIPTYENFNYENEYKKPELFGNFEQFGTKNNEPKIPDGIQKALEMVKNEVFEISLENDDLKNENNNLKNDNNNLRAEIAKKEAEVSVLKNEISTMQSSMAAAQSRILDVFGMGNLNSQANKSSDAVNFGDEEVKNNKSFVA